MKRFCEEVSEQMSRLKLEANESQIDLLICCIDSRTLEINGFNIGTHQLVTQREEVKIPYNPTPFPLDLKSSYFNFTLDRNDKVLIFSSGFMKNFKNDESKSFLKKANGVMKKGITFEDMNDFFFQIKRKSSGQFLKYDASCIYLTVDKNAIFKI